MQVGGWWPDGSVGGHMMFNFTILVGVWFDTDYNDGLRPAELHCCWNLAELGTLKAYSQTFWRLNYDNQKTFYLTKLGWAGAQAELGNICDLVKFISDISIGLQNQTVSFASNV